MLDRTNLNTPGAKVKPDVDQLFDAVDALQTPGPTPVTFIHRTTDDPIPIEQCDGNTIFTNKDAAWTLEMDLPTAQLGKIFQIINLSGQGINLIPTAAYIHHSGQKIAQGNMLFLNDKGSYVKLLGNADGSWNVINQYGTLPLAATENNLSFSPVPPKTDDHFFHIQVIPVSMSLPGTDETSGTVTIVDVEVTEVENADRLLVGFFASWADDLDTRRMRMYRGGQLHHALMFPIARSYQAVKRQIPYRGFIIPPNTGSNDPSADNSGLNLLVADKDQFASYRFWSPITNGGYTTERHSNPGGVGAVHPSSSEGFFDFAHVQPLIGWSDTGSAVNGCLGTDANMGSVKIQLDRIWIEKQGANIRLRIAFNNFSLGTTNFDCKIAVYH